MNHRAQPILCVVAALLGAAVFSTAQAQDVADPLTIQGLDQFGSMSARARAMGGSSVAAGNNVGAMFANPATLMQLTGPEARAGGYFTGRRYRQTQQWVPNRFYAGLSLMLEDLIDGVRDPEPLPPNPADRVQRPYDDIGPRWKKTTGNVRPSLIAVGMPLVVEDVRLAAGIGFSEAANLNTYFQNNNALSPNIGAYRPAPLPVVTGTDSLKVRWYQFLRQREGTINGITPAVSVEVASGLSVGAAVTILFGSSDDREQRIDRGLLTFFYDKFRSDSVYNRITTTGTSDYSGAVPVLGGLLRQESFTLGMSVRLPMTVTRDWERTVVQDTTGATSSVPESGTDRLKLPLLITIAGVLHPSAQVDVSVDYEINRYGNALYTPSVAPAGYPWLTSQSLRAGVEYRPWTWLAVRGGFRQATQTFAAAGAPIIDEPEIGSAYTGGVGVSVDQFIFDLAYEYVYLRYEDSWQSNVNFNKIHTHTVWLETGYRF